MELMKIAEAGESAYMVTAMGGMKRQEEVRNPGSYIYNDISYLDV
jgi:hypothetical protein